MKNLFLLSCLLIAVQGFSQESDPAINSQIGYNEYSDYLKSDYVKSYIFSDSIPPSFTISDSLIGEDIIIYVNSDEDLFVGWVEEKEVWSVANFDYWWLNTRIAKDSGNNIYAAIRLYEYANPNGNFDMIKLLNNGEIEEEFDDWNGPGGNPVIINNPDENIYIGQPTLDKEGVVDQNNITYIASGSSSISFTKIDADGTVLINNETIITGANAWTNEIRIAVDSNNKIYLVWSNDMHDISYAYSEDEGITWSEIISLCYNANQMNKPQVCCDNNNNVHIIWQRWTGSSNLLAYMKLRPDGTIAINESHLTQSNNQVWSPRMSVDEENNIHIVWAKSSQQVTSAYYTKIDGNLDANGQSLSDDELTIIQEQPFLSNESIRYPKCAVDEYENVHTIFERSEYGCNHPKAVYYKKMNYIPLLRIECPDDSLIFVKMTGSGTNWEGTFTPPEPGIYNVRVSGSDIDGNTGVDFYQLEHTNTDIRDNELLSDNSEFLMNYPNPFYNETQITFYIINAGNISLEIYNIKGQLVETLITEYREAGKHSVVWDAKNISSGIYFYCIQTGDFTETKKCILLNNKK